MSTYISLIRKIGRRIKSVLKKFFQKTPVVSFISNSYSQEGEDLILARIFENRQEGYYIDVGAHHPQRFSNTYYFYLKGWSGINIDAAPGSMAVFEKDRPRDINLEIPVSNVEETLTFYVFNEPALSTFSKDNAEQYSKSANYHVVCEAQLQTMSLERILDEHITLGKKIDFLSIDVEGLDYQVLISNNWDKYSPDVILVESLGGASIYDIVVTDTYLFLKDKGYELYCKTPNTLIFRSSQKC